MPTGSNTTNVPRPNLGTLAYGGPAIYNCTKPGMIALTYDDGPYEYTNDLLDILKNYKAKATFFITGVNIGKGRIDDPSKPWPAVIRRMHQEGHKIGSHTWSHQDLSTLTHGEQMDQMIKNEMAFRNILGFWPTYMRPPYVSCTIDSGCESLMKELGYHIVSYPGVA